jgi:hypothetical protein
MSEKAPFDEPGLTATVVVACELCQRGIYLVARAPHERAGSRMAQSKPDNDRVVWQRPKKPRGMTGKQYRSYSKTLIMRQVTVDAGDKNHRVRQFKVVTTILDQSIDGKQIGDLFERRWEGEADVRSIKSTHPCRIEITAPGFERQVCRPPRVADRCFRRQLPFLPEWMFPPPSRTRPKDYRRFIC